MKKKLFSKLLFPLLAVLLSACIFFSMRFGSSAMSNSDFLHGLIRADGYETFSIILYTVRVPRIFAALLAGVGLSVSGMLLQSVTGNALASPNIIGVNSGAGFAVLLFLCFFPKALYTLPLAAFLGAFLTTLLITAAANQIGSMKSSVVLAGIAVTSLLNAGISFLSLLDSDILVSYNYFSIGGISGVQMKNLIVPAIIIFLCLLASLALSRQIDLLCLGDSMALSLGARVKTVRIVCLILASASAAAVVSFAGLLGFVGLIVPHIAGKLVSRKTKKLLTASALTGGIIVILADLFGRILFAPSELPVGIMMSVIGAPFFFFLLLTSAKETPTSAC